MTGNPAALPARPAKGSFYVVVESPAGSRSKLKYDPKLGVFIFSRALPSGLHYPYDWGFIPGTEAPDGDPLDAMVFSDVPTFPGVVIECRALGVIQLLQNRKNKRGRERNDRLIAVPIKMPRIANYRRPSDLSARARREVEEFFLAATRFENKDAEILSWSSAAEGERMVDRCLPGSGQC